MARILVIDDQEPIRRLVRRALEQAGHEVFDASEGQMGMQMLARHAADVVISDIFMPGQDGILTLRQIRKQSPDVKVIVMSGGDSTGILDLRRDAELLGAVKSLQKPFAAWEIVELVRSVLEA
ncbi:MAG TPA: response regulator [Gemmatimonadales bacterium]|nr:response regulator [Gemmatimonadales bacterium]